MKTSFYNIDVKEITGLSQRQIVNWAEKGLVIPVSDAHGAGSKREYNYTNLLEFGLCKTLFNMGLSLHMVKSMLQQLRNTKLLSFWAEHEKEFFQTCAEKIKKDLESGKVDKEYKLIIQNITEDTNLDDPKNFSDIETIKKWLNPKINMLDVMNFFRVSDESRDAVLFFYLEDGEIIPYLFPYNPRHLINGGQFNIETYCNLGIIMVNLGRIKKIIDHRMSLKLETSPSPEVSSLQDDIL